MKQFLLVFIPIFVAVDALGILPIYCALTFKIKKEHKPKIIIQSMVTALVLGITFIIIGKALFNFLGIMLSDFMIAGGIVLFCIALIDIVAPRKKSHSLLEEMAAVPLGTPLIVGPAVLTTSLILLGEFGLWLTSLSIIINVLITGYLFYLSDYLVSILGENTFKVISKVMHLLLAAIAVMLIRKGIFITITLFPGITH